MPLDTKNTVAGLYTLLSKLPLEAYLSSENFSILCSKHDLADTWKGHIEFSRDRPDLYGKEITKNAFVLFFDHLFQTRPGEFLVILAAFLQDFRDWNAHPLPVDAIKKECVSLGFPDKTVEDEFLKIRI
jgi:hypothetical protein